MAFHYNCLHNILISLAVLCFCKIDARNEFCKKERFVRVLLDSVVEDSIVKFCFGSQKGFSIVYKGGAKQLEARTKWLSVSVKNGHLYLQGKPIAARSFFIYPKSIVLFNDKKYRGSIRVVHKNGKFYVVNYVDLEDYIGSVLCTESWPGWPLEVNKVFAITSRSYVMAMMKKARKNKKLYDVCNTNVHQTYSGEHDRKVLYEAVEKTKGVFLSQNDEAITAMFDSCCGGVIPSKINDFDFSKVPYLRRKHVCKYCKRCKIYSWHTEYSQQALSEKLKRANPKISRVDRIKITKKDSAGLVEEIIIYPGNFKLSGKQLYSVLSEVKSFCFTIKYQKDKILFDGRGFGHHMGLCQWGAREMVRDGWGYKRILRFYYPGARFSRLM